MLRPKIGELSLRVASVHLVPKAEIKFIVKLLLRVASNQLAPKKILNLLMFWLICMLQLPKMWRQSTWRQNF